MARTKRKRPPKARPSASLRNPRVLCSAISATLDFVRGDLERGEGDVCGECGDTRPFLAGRVLAAILFGALYLFLLAGGTNRLTNVLGCCIFRLSVSRHRS